MIDIIEKMNEIKTLAQKIDKRINLFEGYKPKSLCSYRGELLFWRQVVNIYGLFADCDLVQIKARENLVDLMLTHNLIEQVDYSMLKQFWRDVSNLRKWFCHNKDTSLYYYDRINADNIRSYLQAAFILNSDIPTEIEAVRRRDWDILTEDLDRRFEEYFSIMKKGFQSWQNSDDREELIDKWIDIFSNALFSNKELMENVLAEIAEFDIRNRHLRNVRPFQLARSYATALGQGGFDVGEIKAELLRTNTERRNNKKILKESIRNSGILS